MTHYDSQTFDAIIARMLARAPDNIDKRENTSILYNAIAPAAAEIAIEYTELETIRNDMSIYTASDAGVDLICADQMITRNPATSAILRGRFNMQLPRNARFSHNVWNYVPSEYLGQSGGSHYYAMKCETVGSAPSFVFGRLVPIMEIKGLTDAELVGNIVPGEDQQTTESLIEEYIESFNTKAYAGNVAAYRKFVSEIDGVGGCLVWTATVLGTPGHVRIVVITSAWTEPSPELVRQVGQEVDPDTYAGAGVGFAPPGAVVTVVGVKNSNLAVTATITLADNVSRADVYPAIAASIRAYLEEVNKTFGAIERQNELNDKALVGLTVRVSRITEAIINTDGVVDATDVRLNGSASNLILGNEQIANLTTLNGDVV